MQQHIKYIYVAIPWRIATYVHNNNMLLLTSSISLIQCLMLSKDFSLVTSYTKITPYRTLIQKWE